MYQLTDETDTVRDLETGMWVREGTWLWGIYQDFLAAGGIPEPVPVPAPPYEPNTPAHHRAIRNAAWTWMAGVVQDRGYDTIESCCSYYNSAVSRYREEARAMVAWRDDVNQTLEGLVLAPPAGVVTWEQVCPLLPQPESYPWPAKLELPLETVEGPITLP